MADVLHRTTRNQGHRYFVAALLLTAMFLAVACDSADGSGVTSDACTKTFDGVQYFDGSRECFEALPQQPIVGYWVVGHENSVFHTERPTVIWELDHSGAWLTISEDAWESLKSYYDGTPHLLEVEFIGVKPGRLGIYDYGFRDGAYMNRLLRAREITEVEWRRGEPPNKSCMDSSVK